jgi:hypothetical protein
MKFYVISIVAIFAALGIGIYIGFTLDTQSFLVEQKDDIVGKLEESFDFLKSENQDLKLTIKEIEAKNDNYKHFIDSTYEEIIKDKLKGKKIAIIETKDDYMYSGIGQILEVAGANVVNVATITDKIMDKGTLKNIYNELNISVENSNLITNAANEIAKSIITGEESILVKKLEESRIMDLVGTIDEPIDYVIIAGGSVKEDRNRITLVDKTIVDVCKDMNKAVIGIEKLKANYSYMEAYKGFKISTVDNVDTTMGKVSLILAMEGRPGHYGIKQTAEELVPNLKLSVLE